MAKGKKRLAILQEKRRRKASEMTKSSGTSRYARKSKWLAKNNLFGFQVPEPKPWKSGT